MNPLAPMPAQPVEILGTELQRIHSARVGQDYLVKVWLPEGYTQHTGAFPVLYLLDGDHAFAMATDIVQYLIYGGHIPPLIIVSPAYGSKKTPGYGGTNMRERDLIPFPGEGYVARPGADHYLEFFQTELIPTIEAAYHIDGKDRTLWGYSSGGVFVLYALFQQPGLFRRYAVVDGLVPWFTDVEADYARQHTALPAKLHLSAGSGAETAEFATVLEGRGYAGLEVGYAPLNDAGHFTVGAEGLTKGLVAVFQDWSASGPVNS